MNRDEPPALDAKPKGVIAVNVLPERPTKPFDAISGDGIHLLHRQ
jgi:hypothetical protein